MLLGAGVLRSLRTTLCMQYKPEHLAYSCLYLAAHINVVEVPLPSGKTFWNFFNISKIELKGACVVFVQSAPSTDLPGRGSGVSVTLQASHLPGLAQAENCMGSTYS